MEILESILSFVIIACMIQYFLCLITFIGEALDGFDDKKTRVEYLRIFIPFYWVYALIIQIEDAYYDFKDLPWRKR